MSLNKVDSHPVIWATEDYAVEVSSDGFGYLIRNMRTGVAEMMSDQEPGAVMAVQYLQDQYDEVMKDPAREYQVRKQRGQQARVPQTLVQKGPKAVN